MKRAILAFMLLYAAPVFAQTANDDMKATENWWDEVGADFFGEATMQEPRPEYEIRAQWTGLSADDQAAVRARCAALEGGQTATAPSLQEGPDDNNPDATAADLADGAAPGTAVQTATPNDTTAAPGASETTTTGSIGGAEAQSASPSTTPAPDTGLAGSTGDGGLVLICDLIPDL